MADNQFQNSNNANQQLQLQDEESITGGLTTRVHSPAATQDQDLSGKSVHSLLQQNLQQELQEPESIEYIFNDSGGEDAAAMANMADVYDLFGPASPAQGREAYRSGYDSFAFTNYVAIFQVSTERLYKNPGMY